MNTYKGIRESYEQQNELEKKHSIRRGFNSNVNSQLDEIVQLLDEVNNKGFELIFDNSRPNHYKLTDNKGNEYEFSLYRDVKNCLLLIINNI